MSTKNTLPEKLSFKNEGEIRNFPDKSRRSSPPQDQSHKTY
jgi:hypothetical protein